MAITQQLNSRRSFDLFYASLFPISVARKVRRGTFTLATTKSIRLRSENLLINEINVYKSVLNLFERPKLFHRE